MFDLIAAKLGRPPLGMSHCPTPPRLGFSGETGASGVPGACETGQRARNRATWLVDPASAEIAPTWDTSGCTSSTLASPGRWLAESRGRRAKSGRDGPKRGRHRHNFGRSQIRPNSGQAWTEPITPKLVRVGPDLAKHHQAWPKFGHAFVIVGRNQQTNTSSRKRVKHTWSKKAGAASQRTAHAR